MEKRFAVAIFVAISVLWNRAHGCGQQAVRVKIASVTPVTEEYRELVEGEWKPTRKIDANIPVGGPSGVLFKNMSQIAREADDVFEAEKEFNTGCRCDVVRALTVKYEAMRQELIAVKKYFGGIDERRMLYALYDSYGFFYGRTEQQQKMRDSYFSMSSNKKRHSEILLTIVL